MVGSTGSVNIFTDPCAIVRSVVIITVGVSISANSSVLTIRVIRVERVDSKSGVSFFILVSVCGCTSSV